jgi:hypothetical protein
MKPVKLQELTINELVGRFVDLGIAQDKAELYGEISKYNRLFKEMTAVDEELRARGREARLEAGAQMALGVRPKAMTARNAAIIRPSNLRPPGAMNNNQ